jgi:anti-sigma regulatory factor (Ser/Thr protein kinase)
MCKKAATTVSCEPVSVAWARRWALGELRSIYLALGEASLDIQTVVSELVTNAVRAKCRRLTLALDAHHTYVRIATSDDAPGDPVKMEPAPDHSHGRGLLVVEALSTRWGVQRGDGGKTVWADIALHGNLRPTFECTN